MNGRVRITPARLRGELAVMASKSVSHRLAICAALAGSSRVENIGLSEDIDATLRALSALGYEDAHLTENVLKIGGQERQRGSRLADCGESGSTLRFLIPLALDGIETVFLGRGRLLARPMEVYAQLFEKQGIVFSQNERRIRVCGTLSSGEYVMRGDVSSQFLSGLLLALPALEGASRIIMKTPLESRAYAELTMQALKRFGVSVRWRDENCMEIPGGQRFAPANVRVEGDFSHAAFFLTAGVLGDGVRLSGLDRNSLQADKAIVEILAGMGADIEWRDEWLTVSPSVLRGREIDVSQIPDLLPVLSVAACAACGETRLVNAARLRTKESDRLAAMAQELTGLGANVQELSDALIIQGQAGTPLHGGVCCAHNDHRVAMSLAVAAVLCEGIVEIDHPGCVRKSAPDFWREYEKLGGKFEMVDERGKA